MTNQITHKLKGASPSLYTILCLRRGRSNRSATTAWWSYVYDYENNNSFEDPRSSSRSTFAYANPLYNSQDVSE